MSSLIPNGIRERTGGQKNFWYHLYLLTTVHFPCAGGGFQRVARKEKLRGEYPIGKTRSREQTGKPSSAPCINMSSELI